jgi:hypothetical protein
MLVYQRVNLSSTFFNMFPAFEKPPFAGFSARNSLPGTTGQSGSTHRDKRRENSFPEGRKAKYRQIERNIILR